MREVAIPGVEQYVRQLQQAQALQNTASPEGGMVGRYFVAPSVTQRLAAALKRMKGDEMEGQAQAGIDAARKQQLEAMQYALTGQRPQAPLKQNQDGGFVAAQRPTTQAEVEAAFGARQNANREQMGIAQSYPVQAPSVQQAPANPVMAERQAMIQRMIASGNPELVRQAAQMMMADQEYTRTRADTRADTLDQRQYQTGRDETQFGRQVQLAGMQNDWQNQRQQAGFGQQAAMQERQIQAQREMAHQRMQATLQAAQQDAQTGNMEALAKRADSIRKEFNSLPEVENFKAVIPAQQSAAEAVQRDTTAADLNLIYATAKIFDPTSVVREGEYATVDASQNPTARMQGMLNYLQGGGKLTMEHRQALLREVNSRAEAAKRSYDAALQSYTPIVTRAGINPQDVFQVLPTLGGQQQPQQSGGATGSWEPQPQDVEAEMRRRGLLK